MQHVLGAQQHFHRLVQRQVYLGSHDDDVVLSARVVRVKAQRIGTGDEARVGGTQLAALAGKAERPRPLLANHLQHHRVARRAHVVGVDRQAWRQQRHHAQGSAADQPPLELAVFRLVCGAVAGAAIGMRRIVPVAPDDVADEEVDDDEEYPGDDEGNGQRVVHLLPVGRQRGRPPRAQEMEEHRSDDDDDECNGQRHNHPPPRARRGMRKSRKVR
ncbi:hypothetical protein D9M72_341670 [compost metagenome]